MICLAVFYNQQQFNGRFFLSNPQNIAYRFLIPWFRVSANFTSEIPCLFSDFSLTFFIVFPDSQSTFFPFSMEFLLLRFWKLLIFWYFFYNICSQKCSPDFSLTFYLNSLTFPRKTELPDSSLTSLTPCYTFKFSFSILMLDSFAIHIYV